MKSERIILRRWSESDLTPFAVLNADPAVAQFLPAPLTRAQSDAFAARIEAHFDMHGFGLWAVELVGRAPFAGFVGLSVPSFEAYFTPCVEIGWRLAREHWGHGFAPEAATLALHHGFGELGLAEIVSFTVPQNRASIRVMQKLGMQRSPDDFDHPRLPIGHRLRRHVLYRLAQSDWEGAVNA